MQSRHFTVFGRHFRLFTRWQFLLAPSGNKSNYFVARGLATHMGLYRVMWTRFEPSAVVIIFRGLLLTSGDPVEIFESYPHGASPWRSDLLTLTDRDIPWLVALTGARGTRRLIFGLAPPQPSSPRIFGLTRIGRTLSATSKQEVVAVIVSGSPPRVRCPPVLGSANVGDRT